MNMDQDIICVLVKVGSKMNFLLAFIFKTISHISQIMNCLYSRMLLNYRETIVIISNNKCCGGGGVCVCYLKKKNVR